MRFLSEVAAVAASNKMDSRSLAIVFTPSLFPVNEDATNIKKVEQTNIDLANKLDIVETLIRHSDAVSKLLASGLLTKATKLWEFRMISGVHD